MKRPPIDLLRRVDVSQLAATATNIKTALQYRGYIDVVGYDGVVIKDESPKESQVAGFRLTARGRVFLANSGAQVSAAISANYLPLSERLWLSAFRRWCRNCPKNFKFCYSDGLLHILIEDKKGKFKNDTDHQIATMKVPWHDKD